MSLAVRPFVMWHAEAGFSEDRRYRYWLQRQWSPDGDAVAFIGLNPSTANEQDDDPTIRRCIRFAQNWGFGGLFMLNLFGIVSADPRVLLTAKDPVGPMTDFDLARLCSGRPLIVAAWGAFPEAKDRARVVAGRIGRMKCLGVNRDGSPKHPLYIRRDTELIDWPPAKGVHP